MPEFSLKDAREFIQFQLEKDAKLDGSWLSQDEHKWFIAQLIQLEQAETLKRLAIALEMLEGR